MKLRIVPYKRASKSAKLLAQAISEKVNYFVYRGAPKDGRKNIYWGRPNPSKLANFKKLTEAGVSTVPYTDSKAEAAEWLKHGTVLARSDGGQGGSGIKMVNPGEVLPDAPLYTKYVKKSKEFRVHVALGEVVEVMEKRKKKGENADNYIRSHNRGWVFCVKDVNEPDGLRSTAIDAVRACGLEFGGVDIIWNQHYNKLFALEVNSAPGLTNSTAGKYADVIIDCY